MLDIINWGKMQKATAQPECNFEMDLTISGIVSKLHNIMQDVDVLFA